MALKEAKKSSSLLAPEGIFQARLARIIEIGEHKTVHGLKDHVFFFYNLVNEHIDDEDNELNGKQFQVRSKPLNNTASQKAALWDHRKVLGPDTMEFSDLLNQAAFLTTEHKVVVNDAGETNTYCNIINISGVPQGIEVPELDIPTFYFDFDNPDADVWENQMWDWIKEKIQTAENYHGSQVEAMVLRLKAMNPDTVEGESE